MLKCKIAVIGLVLLCGARASSGSAVTSIEPFVGEFSEGFESFSSGEIPGPQINLAGPVEILDGNALLSGINPKYNVNPFYIWDSWGGFSLDDLTPIEGHVSAVPFDGTRGLSLQTVLFDNPFARIDFPVPVSEFGGYWVHAVTRIDRGPISLTFFDAAGATIETTQFRYDYARFQGISQWFGWRSTIPIEALTFTGPWAAIDGIQINLLPEPPTAWTLLLAFAIVPRRIRHT